MEITRRKDTDAEKQKRESEADLADAGNTSPYGPKYVNLPDIELEYLVENIRHRLEPLASASFKGRRNTTNTFSMCLGTDY